MMKPCFLLFLFLVLCSCTGRLELQKAIVKKIKTNNVALGPSVNVKDVIDTMNLLLKKWPRWISKRQQNAITNYLTELSQYHSMDKIKSYEYSKPTWDTAKATQPTIDTTKTRMQTPNTEDYARLVNHMTKLAEINLKKQVDIYNRQMAEERNTLKLLYQQLLADSARQALEVWKIKSDQLKKVQLAGDQVVLNFPRANRKILDR